MGDEGDNNKEEEENQELAANNLDLKSAFMVDYCKRGVTKCRRCKKHIPKGELRIGKSAMFKEKCIYHYFHIKCVFESFEKSKSAASTITCMDDIMGFELIKDDDRIMILQLMDETNARRKKYSTDNAPPKRPLAQKKRVLPPSKVRTAKLTPSGLPSINILFTNADILTKEKMSELQQRIITEKPMVIAISEVKPKNISKKLMIQDYAIPGYTLHPKNLDNESGRGIAVYTHESIDKSVIEIQVESTFEEACLLEIRLRGGDVLLFGCIYRSPTPSTNSDQNNDNLNDLLKTIAKKNYSHRCIVGDLNYRDINWNNWTTPHGQESKEAKFVETIRDCYLHQHINDSTRIRGNDEPSTLDLVFTEETTQIADIVHHAPLGKSDHSVITFKFQCYLDYSKPKERYLYHKADWDGMKDELDKENWVENFVASLQGDTSEEIWIPIKSKLAYLKEKYIPKSKATGRPAWTEKGSIPIDERLREAIRKKHAEHRHWIAKKKRGDADAARLAYTRARNRVSQMMRKATRKFERNVASSSKLNPKSFWAYVRRRMKTKCGVSPLLEDVNDKSSLRFGDDEKARILQKQFTSVFTKEPVGDIPSLGKVTESLLLEIFITEEMVEEEIKIMKITKSPGPDDIHPLMLIQLVSYLKKPLAFLFNKTLETGEIPEDWKKGTISSIFKKGAKNRAENYRPISLTSIVCKLMEKFIKRAVLDYLLENDLLSKQQHGFINGRSTVTQLLRYLDECIEEISDGYVVDTIYLDFSKAFDTVPHERLMSKLESYGISGKVKQWIKSFLTGRSQTVKVNNDESPPAPVISGIPQGSVLGPLLFVLYINDLPDIVNSKVYLFADDTKLMRKVTSEDDARALQRDLDELEAWSKKWLLQFNPDKCHVLTIGKFENIRHTERYKLYGKELEHVFEEKDLGVHIDSELKFEEHISNKVNKANALVGLIRRSFSYLDGELFRKLFTTFVRPHLEYAQAVWQPHLLKHKRMIENVQIRATKLVDGLKDLSYEERLRKLNLPTLTFRRERGDMIEVFNHIHRYDKNVISPNFRQQSRPSRKHSFQLVENVPADGVRGRQFNSFYYRTNRRWNNLSRQVVDSVSINSFKNQLDEEWKDVLSKYAVEV